MLHGIRGRIRRLAACDRLLLLLTGGCSIVGIPANYFRVRHPMEGTWQLWVLVAMNLLIVIFWAAIVGAIAYSVVRRQRRLADYGFSLKSGGVASLGMVAVIQAYLVIRGQSVPSAAGYFPWIVLGAFMEELAFRAIAIDKLILLMDGIKAKAFWAILASTVLFSAPHIPSKTPAELQGVILASLLMGYIYYKSRSILLPAWYHGISNAGYSGGIWIALVYSLISVTDWAIRPSKKQATLAAGAPRGT